MNIENEIAEKAERAEKERKKNRRKTILEAWAPNEEALSLGPTVPCFELFDINDNSILPNMINILRRVFKLLLTRWRSQSIKYRLRERQPITERLESISLKSRLRNKIERREVIDEECQRMANTFRKKLGHYEREGVEATSRLRLIEPQMAKTEAELEKLKVLFDSRLGHGWDPVTA